MRRLAILALALLAPATAGAEGFDVELFHPTPSSSGYLSQDAARSLDKGVFNLGVTLGFSRNVLALHDPDTGEIPPDGIVIGDRFVAHLTAGFGLLDILEVGLAVPAVVSQEGDLMFVRPGDELSSSSIGDVRASAKVRLPMEGAFQVAGAVDARFPTGDEEAFAGDGSVVLRPRVIFGVESGRFSAAANAGYVFRQETSMVRDLVVDDELAVGAGAAYRVGPRLWLLGEGYTSLGLEGDSDGNQPAEILGGARFALGKAMMLQGAIGTGLTQGYGSPEVRGVLTVAYAPLREERAEVVREVEQVAAADTDGDGLLDNVDGCVAEPEDKDNFKDEDGCPENDNDEDTIADASDRCPLEKGVPENAGCPDKDTDGDGLVDRTDGCPGDPEDLDLHRDEDGCPDPDNDGDGLADASDKCPLVAEDVDGFNDTDGCPDPDNDGDGFVDNADKCPAEPEVFNGNQDDDGCPDKGKALVVLGQGQIEITQQVRFATNKAKIHRASYRLLATVAKILVLHPEIKKVRVEGHTDDRGSSEKNLKLSQDRADAVRQHLIEVNGIDASRLEATGYGEFRPIASNRKSKGRAKNRRVEFVIVEREAPDASAAPATPAPGTPAPGAAPGGPPAPTPGQPTPKP